MIALTGRHYEWLLPMCRPVSIVRSSVLLDDWARSDDAAGELARVYTLRTAVLDDQSRLRPQLECNRGTARHQVVQCQRDLRDLVHQADAVVCHPEA